MSNIYISVIVPLYNKSYCLDRLTKSLISQEYPFFEVIVINDGSTDDSLMKLKSILNANPTLKDKTTVYDQYNQGVSVARNKGISLAKYDYICFLDADDEWLPEFLSSIIHLIKHYPLATVFSVGHSIIKNNIKKIPFQGYPIGYQGYVDDFFIRSTQGEIIHSSKVCILKDKLTEVGGFPVGIVAGEDLYLWCVLALTSQIAFNANPLIKIHIEQDQSRGARRFSIPYPITYFGREKSALKNKSLKKYLLYISSRHIAGSISEKKYKEALARWKAHFHISWLDCIKLSPLFIIPPYLLRKLRKK